MVTSAADDFSVCKDHIKITGSLVGGLYGDPNTPTIIAVLRLKYTDGERYAVIQRSCEGLCPKDYSFPLNYSQLLFPADITKKIAFPLLTVGNDPKLIFSDLGF